MPPDTGRYCLCLPLPISAFFLLIRDYPSSLPSGAYRCKEQTYVCFSLYIFLSSLAGDEEAD